MLLDLCILHRKSVCLRLSAGSHRLALSSTNRTKFLNIQIAAPCHWDWVMLFPFLDGKSKTAGSREGQSCFKIRFLIRIWCRKDCRASFSVFFAHLLLLLVWCHLCSSRSSPAVTNLNTSPTLSTSTACDYWRKKLQSTIVDRIDNKH